MLFISTLDIRRPACGKSTKQHRAIAKFVKSQLKSQLSEALSLLNANQTVDEQATAYSSALRNIVDKLAPIRTKSMVDKSRAEWYSTESLEERKQLRRLEKKAEFAT